MSYDENEGELPTDPEQENKAENASTHDEERVPIVDGSSDQCNGSA